MTEREGMAVVSSGHVFSMADLEFKLNTFSKKMVLASIAFYITIPVAYYYGNLHWSFIDSLYVSSLHHCVFFMFSFHCCLIVFTLHANHSFAQCLLPVWGK